MVSSSKQSDAGAVERCARDLLDVVPSVMDTLRAAMRTHVGDHISVPQFRSLNFVARHPACTVGELAAFLGVTMPTASALVERLERSGSLRAEPDARDRRRLRLRVTTAGDAQLAVIADGAHGELVRLLGSCSIGELATLKEGLAIMQRQVVRDSPTAIAAATRRARPNQAPPASSSQSPAATPLTPPTA